MRFVEIVLCFGLSCTLMARPHARFDQMYVFGDSYSDIGEGYLDGNGPTAVAYMAKDLGFTLVASDKVKAPTDSLNFAVSGAQTGRSEGSRIGSALLGFGMENQVEEFSGLLHNHKIRFNPKKTLFFLAGGLNDKKMPTDTTVVNLEGEIRTLYRLGGRHFAVALMPTAIPAFSEVGTRLNPAIALIPKQMKAELPLADIRLSHWGPFFDDVMRHPAQYGITNTTDACAGREIFNQDATPCRKPEEHFYYHSGHPSTATHRIVGEMLAKEAS
jgi:phospholipase/lecithinase/hemolysin